MRTNKNGVNKDQKDKVKKDGYNRGQHCVYCLTYHMIFVTHYRKPVINDEMSAMKEFFESYGRAVPWKSFIRRDRQRSYPPAGITATEYQCIRLCKKHQDSVVQRDAQAISGTDQTVYLWGRYLVLEPQLLYRNYRKCFS